MARAILFSPGRIPRDRAWSRTGRGKGGSIAGQARARKTDVITSSPSIVDDVGCGAECPFLAEAVSKLETTRFSGVALPFPTCREADTERFDRSTFSLDVEVARFDTASAGFCRIR